MGRKSFNWWSEHAVELGATVIALAALGLALFEGCMSRRHDRLSVRPRALVSFAYNNDGTGYELVSMGLGPMIVKWFEVKVDGEAVPHWEAMARRLGLSKTDYTFTVPWPGSTYQPGTTSVIFWISAGPSASALKANLERVAIHLCYCSFYDECWISGNVLGEFREASCEPAPEVLFRSPPRG
jgi:hypothetical protein